MKKITFFALLAALILFMSMQSFSQWIEWEKRKLRSFETQGFAITNSIDGNLIVTGTLNSGGYIYKCNQNGDSMWTCLGAWGYSLIEDDSGNIISVMEHDYYKVSSGGSLIWSKNLTDSLYSNIYSNSVIKTIDNKFIIVGGAVYGGNHCGYIAKYDLNGNKIFSNVLYVPNKSYYIYNLSVQGDGTFIAIGNMFGVNIERNFIAKISQTGQFIFSSEFGPNDDYLKTAFGVFRQADGGYLCFTSYRPGDTKLIISKLDSLGNFLWSKTHGDLNRSYSIRSGQSIIRDNFRNQYIVAGSKPYFGSPKDTNFCSLASYDSLGNLLWEKMTYSDSFPSYFNGITQNSDSSFVICGDAFVNYNSDLLDSPDYLYLLKTKKINTIGINNISSEIPGKFALHQNYPNPFNPVTKIKFELPKASNMEFNVYDILGRKVYTEYINKSAGTYEIDFDASDLPSGVYFYSLKAGEYFDSKKMVVLK